MNPAAAAAIPTGATIVLDTSAVLAYLTGTEAASEAAAAIVDDVIATGRAQAIVSAVTVAETLVRPLRSRSATAVQIVEDFLLRFPNLSVEPVTADVGREAARIRAVTAVRTPDAIILATAVHVAATMVVGNDRSWPALAKRAGLSFDVAVLGT